MAYDYPSMTPFQQAFFENDPQRMYSYYLSSYGFSPAQQYTMQRQYNNIYSGYLRQMVQQPSLNFGDYLNNYNSQAHLRNLDPYSRGVDLRQYAHPTRWVTV